MAGYEAGKSMKELATEFGINRRTVPTYLGGVEGDDAVAVGDVDDAPTPVTGTLASCSWPTTRAGPSAPKGYAMPQLSVP